MNELDYLFDMQNRIDFDYYIFNVNDVSISNITQQVLQISYSGTLDNDNRINNGIYTLELDAYNIEDLHIYNYIYEGEPMIKMLINNDNYVMTFYIYQDGFNYYYNGSPLNLYNAVDTAQWYFYDQYDNIVANERLQARFQQYNNDLDQADYYYNEYYEEGYRKGFEEGQATSPVDSSIITMSHALATGFKDIISIEILPHVSIGAIMSIPLTFGLIAIVINIFKGN